MLTPRAWAFIESQTEEDEAVDADEEEELTEEEQQLKTGEYCPKCEKHILYGQDVVYVTVVQGTNCPGGVIFKPALDADEVEEVYRHVVIHDDCFQEAYGTLQDYWSDHPPSPWPEPLLPITCDACGEHIPEHEPHAHLWPASADLPEAQPTGDERLRWVLMSRNPYRICIGCLALWHDEEELVLWHNFVGAAGECAKCTMNRCWHSKGTCTCWCHG